MLTKKTDVLIPDYNHSLVLFSMNLVEKPVPLFLLHYIYLAVFSAFQFYLCGVNSYVVGFAFTTKWNFLISILSYFKTLVR